MNEAREYVESLKFRCVKRCQREISLRDELYLDKSKECSIESINIRAILDRQSFKVRCLDSCKLRIIYLAPFEY